jgi:hypothetical protein
MKKTIDILLAFNDASRIQADQFAQMLLEAFNAGNLTDAQVEDVSGLLKSISNGVPRTRGISEQ